MRDKARGDLRTAAKAFIDRRRLLQPGDRVIVALSGGADSVALLHLLISLKEEYNLTISAAHLNHGIRGAEADRDEDFVIRLCRDWGVHLHRDRVDVPAAAAESGESIELCGRRLRYEFLEELCHDLDAKLATAHHSGDNTETVLWNLTRGSGLSGLCGIPAERGCIIRPLLGCSRAQIESYCAAHGLEYVTDSTNLSDAYTRNRLRHQVVPVLRELNPQLDESILRLNETAREADGYLNNISVEELNKARMGYGYSCEKLLRLPPIVLKYALKNLPELRHAPVDFCHIALIIEAMQTGGAVELGGHCTVSCAQGILRVIRELPEADDDPENEAVFITPFADYAREHGVLLTVRDGALTLSDEARGRLGKKAEKIHNLFLKDAVPCGIITSDTVMRARLPGDTFTDSRRGVTKTLKKLMNELKIPREKRNSLRVVAEGSVVLWLEGVGTSAHAKADPTLDGDYILIQ